MPSFQCCILCCALLFNALCWAEDIRAEVDFARDVRPILSDHCFQCHGPDAKARQANLRLDSSQSVFGDLADSGTSPIVPGDSAASEIIRRLLSEDDAERMPPPEADKRPNAAQIELLREWIDAGAEWKSHWAFERPRRHALPDVRRADWIRNPIDRFVLAKLEEQGVAPAPSADKVTLVRRLYLDLTGLPPTTAAVDAFLTNDSPSAYEELIDRLLASSAYGEHMASHWLDAARFADTNGYQNDFRRSMWLWRDWVIHAFNDNMPFDQFAIEQLAGDMLPEATLDQRIASGFNRNHRSNTEGGSINEEWLVENVVDRVETTATVFLGLTMGCARCHDHKYDPISQREFYQFFSYFYNIDEQGVYTETRGNVGPMVSVETPEYKQRMSDVNSRLAKMRDELNAALTRFEPMKERWISDLRDAPEVNYADEPGADLIDLASDALEAAPNAAHSVSEHAIGTALSITEDSAQPVNIADAGNFDAAVGFTVMAWVRPTRYGAIISRMDKRDAYRGFDMLVNPDGRLTVHLIHHWPDNGTKVTTKHKLPLNQWTFVAVFVTPPGSAADVSVSFNTLAADTDIESDTLDGSTLTDHPTWIGLRADTQPYTGQIAHLRLIEEPVDEPAGASTYTRALRRLAVALEKEGTEDLAGDLERQFEVRHPELRGLRERLSELEVELAAVKKELPTTMVMKELETPRQTYVLNRGQYDLQDEAQPVQSGVPALFNSQHQPANRLELARWLVNGDNPLTARVAVNHFWARYFGVGLVETPENFGVQSSPPSHPLLLDWLAVEFVGSGWDIKALQKLIVTSATYRQASAVRGESFRRDPNNRWLARGSRFRLPAETIRDNALAISGLLTSRIGGPSVKPYQPDGLWEELAGGAKEPPYERATGEDLYRRSLYTYRKRTVPHPTMSTFDGTSREICVVARSRTNTPLQALALLNDATYVEAARALAEEAMRQFEAPSERIDYAFRRAVARRPSNEELVVLLSGLNRYLARFHRNPEHAEGLLATGESIAAADMDPVELAAYSMVANVILNLDETITRE